MDKVTEEERNQQCDICTNMIFMSVMLKQAENSAWVRKRTT